jgi:DNA-binding response OmpR family regulator
MSRILLVDDDEPLRKMLCLILVKMGHQVLEARDGNEALHLCQAEPPELVLTDLIMPEKEGLETIGELRRLHPEVKIIAMSGGGRGDLVDYLKVAKQMGAARALNKPFSYEALAAAIAEVMGRG